MFGLSPTPDLSKRLPAVEYFEVPALAQEANNWNHQSEDDSYSVASADHTGSMKPYLVGGETLLMQRKGPMDGVQPGELVVLRTMNGRRVHQIVELGPGWFRSKGIANEKDDGKYAMDKIQYVVRRVLAPSHQKAAAAPKK